MSLLSPKGKSSDKIKMIKKDYKGTQVFILLIIAILIVKFNPISAATTELNSSCCQIEPSPPRCGDTNGDRRLDESDLITITSYAFEGNEIPEGLNVDLNGDGIVDILDVVTMTNYVKRNGANPRCGVVINEPLVWMCDDRNVYDDYTEPGRISEGGEPLIERMNNYLFEGEQIHWGVLVYNENGIENLAHITDDESQYRNNFDAVYVTIGDVQGEGNNLEVYCMKTSDASFESCNARIIEEELEWDPNLMAFYSCTLTIETPDGMYGEYWVTVEARNNEGYLGTMDENEYWYFNPEISLSVEGNVDFGELAPGKTSYSNDVTIRSSVDEGSGVVMDMFISGTDFGASQSNSYCGEKQTLSLDQFKYYAETSSYNTTEILNSDWEGYRPISYGWGFNDPQLFYNNNEIIPKDRRYAPYYMANILRPDQEMNIRFKLNIPRDCNGAFENGAIYIWGEAI